MVPMSDATAHWESRYAERDRIWSARPNQALVAAVGHLPAGKALDLGSGEGADAVWLAERGWQVTAVDVSPTAVARARELASDHRVPPGQITWLVEDLADWVPQDHYDLVSACFLHSSIPFPRAEVLRRAAAAVAPEGHLLVVGHAAPPPWAAHHHDGHGEADHHLPGPAEALAGLQLDDGTWEILVCELRSRQATGPNGQEAELEDVVILGRRHKGPSGPSPAAPVPGTGC